MSAKKNHNKTSAKNGKKRVFSNLRPHKMAKKLKSQKSSLLVCSKCIKDYLYQKLAIFDEN